MKTTVDVILQGVTRSQTLPMNDPEPILVKTSPPNENVEQNDEQKLQEQTPNMQKCRSSTKEGYDCMQRVMDIGV